MLKTYSLNNTVVHPCAGTGIRGIHAGDTRLYADGRRVSHICATYNHAYNIPENRQHRYTGIINTQRAGAYQPECTGSLFRGRQYNSVPSVAANSEAADSQSLP